MLTLTHRTTETAADRRFDTLILPCRAALTAQARRLTGGDQAESEDLVQETLLRAYTRLGNITSEATVKGWLHAILRNIHLSRCQRRAHAPRSVSLNTLDAETLRPASSGRRSEVPEQVVIRRLEHRAALAALAELPAAYRNPILLADIDGLTYQDIAHRLQVPVGTVRSRIARGRQRIRGTLRAWDSLGPEPSA